MEVDTTQSASDDLFPDDLDTGKQNQQALAAAKKRASKPQPRVRDEVFWTELEIRRLSNLVAEGIHSRRYVGTSLAAVEERQQLRVYIEAMKRKAMRVLHRAELFVRSAGAAWPGIDRSIADPVSLADEYVRLVQDYLAVIAAEEERVRKEALANAEANAEAEAEAENNDGKAAKGEKGAYGNGHEHEHDRTTGATDKDAKKEDWEVEDETAYRQAVEESKRQANGVVKGPARDVAAEDRRELLAGATGKTDVMEAEGVRRRRTGDADSSDDRTVNMEEEMARNRPIQDELTSKLVDIVGQLKESVTENKALLDKDRRVLSETEDAVERNVAAVGTQRKRLGAYAQRTATSWWTMLIAVVVIIVVFLFVALLLAAPV